MDQIDKDRKPEHDLDWLTERVGLEGVRPFELETSASDAGAEQDARGHVLVRAARAVGEAVFAIVMFPFRLVFAFVLACLQDAKVGLPAVALLAALVYFVGPAVDWTAVERLLPFAPKPVILAQDPSAPGQVGPATRVTVANTSGSGITLRQSPSAEGVVAWPEGTTLEIIGTDVIYQGKPWKHLRDPEGNEGYVAAEFTTPAR